MDLTSLLNIKEVSAIAALVFIVALLLKQVHTLSEGFKKDLSDAKAEFNSRQKEFVEQAEKRFEKTSNDHERIVTLMAHNHTMIVEKLVQAQEHDRQMRDRELQMQEKHQALMLIKLDEVVRINESTQFVVQSQQYRRHPEQ